MARMHWVYHAGWLRIRLTLHLCPGVSMNRTEVCGSQRHIPESRWKEHRFQPLSSLTWLPSSPAQQRIVHQQRRRGGTGTRQALSELWTEPDPRNDVHPY